MADDDTRATIRTAAGAVTGDGARAWLAGLPPALAAQRRLLGSLVLAAEADPVMRWLELGGSLARGAGDGLSDIDAGLGVADGSWVQGLAAAQAAAHAAGPVADEFRQPHPGRDGQQSWHLFTLYESGLQLSLVVMPASWRAGLPPQSVALYDPDGQLARPWQPDVASASAATAREWACLGWVALGDLAKYLDRGSGWEARARLEEARAQAWQLWAVATGAVYPAFGLTAVLDAGDVRLPPGLDATAAGPDPADLRRAAIATATLLAHVTTQAQRKLAFAAPVGLEAWVRGRLAAQPGHTETP
jgi:hypothetical protein